MKKTILYSGVVVATICMLLVAVVLFVSTGEREEQYTGRNIGTTCGNINMGQGKFAYSNGFIYFSDFGKIYEYNTQNGKTVVLPLDKVSTYPTSLFVSSNAVWFSDYKGLQYITKDGKKQDKLFERDGKCVQFYADEMDAYYLSGVEGSLYHRDMSTGTETQLISYVNGYYVDNNSIYAVAKRDGKKDNEWMLYQKRRSDAEFEEISLSFQPIAVNVLGDTIYLAQRKTYQITKYKNGVETPLPIYGTYFQAIDDCIIYSDSTGFKNSCFPIKNYNMNTGENALLCENVYDFCIFEDRYLCCECIRSSEVYYMLIDLKMNTSVQMYPIPETA